MLLCSTVLATGYTNIKIISMLMGVEINTAASRDFYEGFNLLQLGYPFGCCGEEGRLRSSATDA